MWFPWFSPSFFQLICEYWLDFINLFRWVWWRSSDFKVLYKLWINGRNYLSNQMDLVQVDKHWVLEIKAIVVCPESVLFMRNWRYEMQNWNLGPHSKHRDSLQYAGWKYKNCGNPTYSVQTTNSTILFWKEGLVTIQEWEWLFECALALSSNFLELEKNMLSFTAIRNM